MDELLNKRIKLEDLKTEKERDYYNYIVNHIAGVQKTYRLLVEKGIVKATAELDKQIEQHDSSKFNELEFYTYCKNFHGDDEDKKEVGRKSVIEPEITIFNISKTIHELENKHHWEFWCARDISTGKCIRPASDMPEDYIIEMICDWMSIGINKGNLNDIHDYYERKKNDILLTPKTRAWVEDVLSKIKEKFGPLDKKDKEK